ncbi:glycine betaine ABC transporter substrate-binding protein [Enterobacter bugandensis]|uniref:glycine betaine ABC transporter substrate-binding protein n=1 Tax=Enterobacter bugandensis TaxID=881260 RepID=UPI002074EDA2|nr:glycine betaine ABC transporter substrate-binding protein [Enterobacter bugandensis]MCM7631937.1 hypothetical protein [Enterobacter bugandensis]
MDTVHYILDNWDYLLTLTLQHLWLVALAVGLAIIIGVPLGILIVRHKWLATPVLGIATIVLTIPSNTYAFAMQRKRAEAEHINTMSEMVAKIEQVRKTNPDKNWLLGLDLEFAGRSDGMKPLQEAYKMDLDRPQIRQMDPGLVYNAVRDGFVDAGLVYTTDGRVKGFDLKVLEDDKGFFPSYAVTPVVRKDTLEANPGLEEALNTLSAQLNNDVITELNKKVDIDHQSPQQVARDFLRSKQLL